MAAISPAAVTVCGGLKFGGHAAGPERRPRGVGRGHDCGEVLDDVELVLAGLVAEDALDGREEHEQVGPEKVRDHGGQDIVLAEADLIDADRVVLVDDRDRP